MTTALVPAPARSATPAELSPVRLLVGWAILLGGLVGWWFQRPFFDVPTWTNLSLAVLFVTSKIATLICMPPVERRQLPWGHFVAYCLWPGMQPRCFLPGYVPDPTAPVPTLSAFLVNLAIGVVLLWMVPLALPASTPLAVRLWIGLFGYGFLVIFALMDAWALVYRALGFPVERLWWTPIVSRSLNEFWGKRWNRIFSGMLRDLLFRPLVRHIGVVGALFAVFLYSGVLHENATVGPGFGYGGPTLYFLIQFAGMILERTSWLRPRLQHPALGWLWTLLVVAGPVSLLVHSGYLNLALRPMLRDMGVPGLE
jgi:alginate O-acetyltransferase complex protein AlgI